MYRETKYLKFVRVLESGLIKSKFMEKIRSYFFQIRMCVFMWITAFGQNMADWNRGAGLRKVNFALEQAMKAQRVTEV